jgi:iron complex outermembrane receptor protein
MKPTIHFGLLSATALAGTLAFAPQALAQDAEEGSGVNEIIVTAQKREQSIQDVPVAVSALGQEMIQANRITKTTDLTGLAPGLVARVNPGGNASPSFSLRGASANASVPTQDKQIPIYLDGIYIGGNRGSISDVVDLERVEVLRGPQGTLFGRNATAGAVQFITRDPTGELGYIQEFTVGNYDQFRSRTTVDLPQTGPFSAYVTYVHDERRGDIRNLGAGTTFNRVNPFSKYGLSKSPKWLGGSNSESIATAIRFDNGGDVTASYRFSWYTRKGTEARPTIVINPANLLGSFLLQAIATQPAGGGAYGPVTIITGNRRPKAVNNAWTQNSDQQVTGHNFTLEWQASDSLTVKNIFGYRKSNSFGPATIDGVDGLEYNAALKTLYTTPSVVVGALPDGTLIRRSYQQLLAPNADPNTALGSYFVSYGGNSAGKFWQVSDELQVNYTTDRLVLTAGAMYYYSKGNEGSLDGFTNNFATRPVDMTLPLGNVYDDYGTTKSIAAYIQVEYQLTDQLGVEVGGRITKETKFSRLQTGGVFTGDRYTDGQITGTTTVGQGTFKKTKPTYSIGLNYKPNDDILVFAKYATAFLSGGATGDVIFKPETAKSWEAGLKSDWLDGKLRFNLTGYHVKYNNSQATLSGRQIGRPDLGVAVITIADITVKGLELDLAVAPFDGFTLGGTLGYTDDSWKNINPIYSQGRPVRRVSTPAWVGSGYMQYVAPLGGDTTLTFRTDATYQSRQRSFAQTDLATFRDARGVATSAVFVPYEFLESKVIVNGRVALKGIEFAGTDVELAVWGKNLFDSKKGLYPFDFGHVLYSGNFQPARTFGLDLSIKFNHP